MFFAENFQEYAILNAIHEEIFKLYIFIESRSEYFLKREDEAFCFVWFRTQLVRVTQQDFYKNWRLPRLLSIFELLVK